MDLQDSRPHSSLMHTLMLFKGLENHNYASVQNSYGPSETVSSHSEITFFIWVCLTTTSNTILIKGETFLKPEKFPLKDKVSYLFNFSPVTY